MRVAFQINLQRCQSIMFYLKNESSVVPDKPYSEVAIGARQVTITNSHRAIHKNDRVQATIKRRLHQE
jgi:hypothetical protein